MKPPATPGATPVGDRMERLVATYGALLERIAEAADRAGRPDDVRLVAASKAQPGWMIDALAGRGQRAFGENYVQEALGKQGALPGLALEWHLIGALQSNKARAVATHFDWVQSLDRPKLVSALSRHRPASMGPLDVLIQVNIDAEPGKAGCRPEDAAGLADAVARAPGLRLRGLMAVPAPSPARPRQAFRSLAALQRRLAHDHPGMDCLSIGMSGDFEAAIEEGATMVRIGSALFGARRRSLA